MSRQEKIAAALQYIEDNYALPAYFRRLAELGIVPEDEQEKQFLIKLGEEAGELLEQCGSAGYEKTAADMSAAVDPKLLEAVQILFSRD